MADFKYFGPKKFHNLSVLGEIEYKMKPWMMNFIVSFKLTPTPEAKDYFENDERKFHYWLANSILGLRALEKTSYMIILGGWKFQLVVYRHDHDPHEFRLGKPNDFAISYCLVAPSQLSDKNDVKGLQHSFDRTSELISRLPNFESNNLIIFKG